MNSLFVYLPIAWMKRVKHRIRLLHAYARLPFFGAALKKCPPILVYQMGKVGSSSVYFSLKKAYSGVVLHTHELSADHENPLIRRLYRWVVEQKHPVYVISLTREPMIKNVSGFFHNYERYMGERYSPHADLERVRDAFLDRYVHDNVLTWFDDHILRNFGLDVFQTAFPSSGILEMCHEQLRLLILRSELADPEKEQAIQAFLGLGSFRLKNRNIGAKKYYADLYRDFVGSVTLPEEYRNRMAHSKYYQHFYDAESIEAECRRWGRE